MRNVYAVNVCISVSLLYISASNINAKKYVFVFVDSMYGYEHYVYTIENLITLNFDCSL